MGASQRTNMARTMTAAAICLITIIVLILAIWLARDADHT